MSNVSVCPGCERALQARQLPAERPHSWEDLIFRCDDCGWGYSNASAPRLRRRIAREPELNVPVEVRANLGAILDRAANIRNRGPKKWKFCSEESEDAVTWTIVRGLQQLGALKLLVPESVRHHADGEPSRLLWGAPAGGPAAAELAGGLASICAALGERPSSRTEPDVVVAWPGLLLIAEVKLGSANDKKPSAYRGWTLYDDGPMFAAAPAEVRATGLYELVRNWRIGSELAEGRQFLLVNLGRESLDRDVARLEPALAIDSRHQLVARVWRDVVPDEPAWLIGYAKRRRLTSES